MIGNSRIKHIPWALDHVVVIFHFQTHIKDRYIELFLRGPSVNAITPHLWLVNIGSVEVINKPLPEWWPSSMVPHGIARPQWVKLHSGETDEANWSWLHLIWPPPKQPVQDSTVCMVSRTSTKLILCTRKVYDVWNSVFKPHRIVWERCWDISWWKSQVMKPTVLGDETNCRAMFT